MEYTLSDKFEEFRIRNNYPTLEELSKLPTPRLLAFFKKHRGIRHVGICGCGCGEPMSEIEDLDDDTKQFFDDCLKYIDEIKSMLDKREHVE